MNSLSWFLYFADIAENIKNTLQGVAGVLGLVSLLLLFGWTLSITADKPNENVSNKLLKHTKLLGVLVVVLGTMTLFIPTKQTMLSIAASETAERVAKSTEGREILSKLKDKILERIN